MKVKDLVMAIIEYPIFLIVGVMWNCIHDLILQPIHMARLRSRGISVLCNVNPALNYKELKEKFPLGRVRE